MKELILEYIGDDNWDRPVYENQEGDLFVDADPRENTPPNLCTKLDNDFYGEPDTPICYISKYKDAEITFVSGRVVWRNSQGNVWKNGFFGEKNSEAKNSSNDKNKKKETLERD